MDTIGTVMVSNFFLDGIQLLSDGNPLLIPSTGTTRPRVIITPRAANASVVNRAIGIP